MDTLEASSMRDKILNLKAVIGIYAHAHFRQPPIL